MKFGTMTSIAHNLATSVSDGASFLFGAIGLSVHEEALASPNGRIAIDFLRGTVTEGKASRALRAAVARSPEVLGDLCQKHGANVSDFKSLFVHFGVDEVYGSHFTVLVEDMEGRRSEERYQGYSGRRLRRGHKSRA